MPPIDDAELEAAVCECVYGLMPTLKPEYRDILHAIEIEGQTVAEMATRFSITRGNAAVRLHRARPALRKQLEVACGTCTEHGCLDCSSQQTIHG